MRGIQFTITTIVVMIIIVVTGVVILAMFTGQLKPLLEALGIIQKESVDEAMLMKAKSDCTLACESSCQSTSAAPADWAASIKESAGKTCQELVGPCEC